MLDKGDELLLGLEFLQCRYRAHSRIVVISQGSACHTHRTRKRCIAHAQHSTRSWMNFSDSLIHFLEKSGAGKRSRREQEQEGNGIKKHTLQRQLESTVTCNSRPRIRMEATTCLG